MPEAIGDIAIEFLHTKFGSADGPPGGPMPLNEYDDLLAWGIKMGVLDPLEGQRLRKETRRDPATGRRAYDRAIRFRSALDAALRAVIVDDRPPAGSLTVLRSDEADALAAASLVDSDGAFGWTWGPDVGLARPLWPVVHDAIELMTIGPLDRVKACDLCQYLFIDRSKNRSRRWCSMAACGTTEKMRRYTERRAAKRRA